MNRHTCLFTLLFAATPTLLAQEQQPAAVEMPAPKHKEHDALKTLAGQWEIVMKMEAMPGVEGMEEATESKGTEQADLICNGLWLKSVVNAEFKGAPFQGVWLAGYDPFQKQYVSVWVGSDEKECGPSMMNGSYDEKTKTWTWNGKTPQGEMRSSFTFKDADHTVETCYMKTPDGKEAQCMEITRTRSRKPAAALASSRAPIKVTKEHELLHKDVGNWSATIKMAGAPGEAATEEPGSERVAAICDGQWLWTDFEAKFMGAPFEGHGLIGYDPNEKQYVSFWIDSTSPALMKTSGSFDAAKKAYKMAGSSVDPTGQPMKVEEVLTWKDDNTRVLQMQFKSAAQTQNMEITYKRKTK